MLISIFECFTRLMHSVYNRGSRIINPNLMTLTQKRCTFIRRLLRSFCDHFQGETICFLLSPSVQLLGRVHMNVKDLSQLSCCLFNFHANDYRNTSIQIIDCILSDST